MSSVDKRRFRRFKKKKIWPSVFAFVVVGTVCVAVDILFLHLCILSVLGTKVAGQYEDVAQYGGELRMLTEGGAPLQDAAEQLFAGEMAGQDIYVTGADGRVVYRTGDSQPNFDRRLDIQLLDEIAAFEDSAEVFTGTDEIIDVYRLARRDIMDNALETKRKDETYMQFMKTPVFGQAYWLGTPVPESGAFLYVKCRMEVERQDVFFALAFGIAAQVFLLIPVVLLFIHTIRSAVLQKGLTQLIYMDTVTGGRNWLYFKNYGERILTRLVNNKKAFALVNLHLERYQNYRACYGVQAGESLLESMDGFLSARVGRNEAFARYEGADFGLLLQCDGDSDEERADRCRKRIRSLLAELTGLRPNQKIHFDAGINMIPPHVGPDVKWYSRRKDVDIDQLYTYANAARVETAGTEEQRISFFDEDMLGRQKWERWVEDTMETALRNEEFEVYLQPKYNPVTGKLVGAEALVRWISLSTGLITPSHFIPIFERTGFITQLDDYMISRVAKLQAEWMIQGRKAIPISVNVSRAHFAQEGLADNICRLVDAYGPSHDLIELEVTESAFFEEKDILVETVKQLKAYGFRVSMDDFGAGYSSLNSLKDIPLDVLKLDGEFFRGSEDDGGRGEIVVREAIQLAKNLHMSIVAEGIEKKEQVDFLASQGCDMIQGFYFAKPMPVEEFMEKMEKDA